MTDFEDRAKYKVHERRTEGKQYEKLTDIRGDFFVVAEGDSIHLWTKDDCFKHLPKMIEFMKREK